MKRLAVIIVLCCGGVAAAAAAAEPPALVVVHATHPADVRALLAAGVDVDTCAARRPDGVLAYCWPDDLATVTAMGLSYEVLFADARDAVAWTEAYDGPRYAGAGPIPYDHYLSYAELTAAMQYLAATYPTITRLSSLGTTVEGRDIWALKVTANPDAEELEPEFRLVGAHHGNEKISYMVALYAAEQFCARYGAEPAITALVDGAEIWVTPMLNADGVEANSRYNAHNVDLNRNYSYAWKPGSGHGPKPFSEPETRAVRDNARANTFVMSHSYHSGARYVNYVWNYKAELPKDIAMIRHLSKIYGALTGYPPINGYSWYETHGDLNDWSYGERGDPDDTIEVYGPGYNPPTGEIESYGQLNWPAIVATFEAAREGVIYGVVKDAATLEPLAATVTPLEIGWPAYTDATTQGDYYKMLRPGTYTMKASADGYASSTKAGVQLGEGAPTRLDFYLRRSGVGLTLSYFRAAGRPRGVLLSWKTAGGGTPAGFNLYRKGAGDDAGATAPRARVNGALVRGRSPYNYLDAGVAGGRWEYELAAVDAQGREEVVGSAAVDYAGPGAAKAFALGAAYPNPARARATVPFTLPAPSRATLGLYDLCGRKVVAALDAELAAGTYEATLELAALPPGVYIYRLAAGDDHAARRLAVVK